MNPTDKSRGFTLIEILIAMTIIAVTFVPLMHMFVVAMDNINHAKVMTTAISIGRHHMEMVKNLNLTEDRLRAYPSPTFYPPEDKLPLEINATKWRIKRIIDKKSDPVKVDIEVYEEGASEPAFTLTTLFEDIF